MEFTKGKWINNTPDDSNGYQNIADENGLTVATCYGKFERTIPNAKLIESAPEMFDELVKIMETYDKGTETYIRVMKLLTKITEK
jgi:hypothetical protein